MLGCSSHFALSIMWPKGKDLNHMSSTINFREHLPCMVGLNFANPNFCEAVSGGLAVSFLCPPQSNTAEKLGPCFRCAIADHVHQTYDHATPDHAITDHVYCTINHGSCLYGPNACLFGTTDV